MVSVAVFVLQWRIWIVVTGTVWSQTVLSGPYKKFVDSWFTEIIDVNWYYKPLIEKLHWTQNSCYYNHILFLKKIDYRVLINNNDDRIRRRKWKTVRKIWLVTISKIYSPFQLYGCVIDKYELHIFKMCNVIFWCIYTLWNDYHNQANQYVHYASHSCLFLCVWWWEHLKSIDTLLLQLPHYTLDLYNLFTL